MAGLQLVHVARGDAQRAGQGGLGKTAFLTETAKPYSYPGLRDHHHTLSGEVRALLDHRSPARNFHTPANSRAGPAGLPSANRSRPLLTVFTSVTESRAERHKPPHMQVYHSARL